MDSVVKCSAQELLRLNKDELLRVRRYVVARMHFRQNSETLPLPDDEFLRFMMMLSMVQDMRAWSALAEPGIAPKLVDLGPEWEPHIESARRMDRRSLDAHNEIVIRFEEAGGREGLQEAIDQLNQAFAITAID